jgi:protease-4
VDAEHGQLPGGGLLGRRRLPGPGLRKYGVNAEFEQRYEYKNAVNEYTQSDFTAAHREAMTAWMTSIYTSALANAAQDRKVTPQR